MPKMYFWLSLILLRFPPKKAKCVVSARKRKSRQQIGLKAHKYIAPASKTCISDVLCNSNHVLPFLDCLDFLG